MKLNINSLVATGVFATSMIGQSSARLGDQGSRQLMGSWGSWGSGSSCIKSWAVVANRGSGSVSFIPEDGNPDGTATDVITVMVPDSEPMYVNADQNRNKIFVGDRTTAAMADRILVFDPEDIENPTMIDLDMTKCNGVFHQWLNVNYLAVSCVTTDTIALISLGSMSVVDYIELDLAVGEEPHDVVINSRNTIFVTTVETADSNVDNHIIKINASGQELDRINVGPNADPHVALDPATNAYLYAPQQGNDKMAIYGQRHLNELQVLDIDNAHGICFSRGGSGWLYLSSNLYLTDINGNKSLVKVNPRFQGFFGGSDAEVEDEEVVVGGSGAQTVGVAHNCASTTSGKIFVTHSGGTATAVTLMEDVNGNLENKGFFVAGTNPFGIGIFEGCIED